MHSLMHRTNTVLTFFGTVAAILCILTTSTDLLHKANQKVDLKVAEVKKLVKNHHQGRDQAVLTLNLDADLRSVFSWNTKQLFVFVQAEYVTPDHEVNQIVLWDSIIKSKDKAHIKLKNAKTKYAFIDHQDNLRGRRYNMSLVWNVMPRVGYLYTRSQSFDAGKLPSSYQQ